MVELSVDVIGSHEEVIGWVLSMFSMPEHDELDYCGVFMVVLGVANMSRSTRRLDMNQF